MKNILLLFSLSILLFGCSTYANLRQYGKHYQKYKDYKSLSQTVELIPLGVKKSFVRKFLGEPIDNGFDYRYLIDSTGINGCTIGAVFHINEKNIIDQKWVDEICE